MRYNHLPLLQIYKMEGKWFFPLIVTFTLPYVTATKPKIAIVGSGIGGSSTAYFIREYLQDAVSIDLYEANKIGGRLATAQYGGDIYETGGCIIHERNKYMNEFRKKFQLNKRADNGGDGYLGIRGKDGFEFFTSNFKFLTYIKLLLRYGYSLVRLHSFVEDMLNHFDKIYELQNQGHSFATVEELFVAACPNFVPYFNVTSKYGFSKFAKLNDRTVDELVTGSLRVNYGQTSNAQLFVGAVSVAGMFGELWGIENGNKQVPQLLVQNASVNFLRRVVKKIEFDKKYKRYNLESEEVSTGHKAVSAYDIVVLAAPITDDSKSPIKFVNFTKPIVVKGRYHRTVATLVSGNLNASFYGLPENDLPDLIINNDVDDVVNSVGRVQAVNGVGKSKSDVWKVFSQRELRLDELGRLFQKQEIIEINDWLAYPEYEFLNLSRKFVLHDRLYYVNAIEWAASAMEMSVIGAKNVALLVNEELTRRKAEKQEIKINFKKIEL